MGIVGEMVLLPYPTLVDISRTTRLKGRLTMSMISAAIALAAAVTPTSEHAPTHPFAALLETWLRSGACPKPESFQPTTDHPFLIVQIGTDADGRQIEAYGVQYMSFGLTGPGLCTRVQHFYWNWYLDRIEAVRRARLEAFRNSDEGHAWVNDENYPAKASFDALCTSRMIEFDLIVYRVARSGFEWTLCLEEDVCTTLHSAFREWMEPRVAQYPPVKEDATEVIVPEVKEVHIAGCPHCLEKVFGYWAPDLWNGWQPYFKWVPDRATAEAKRAKVIAYFEADAALKRKAAEAKLERDLKLAAWVPANELRGSPRYRDLEGSLDLALRTRFDELYHLGLDETTLAQAEELEGVTRRVEEAMMAIEGAVLEEIMEGDLVPKLQGLLSSHLPQCTLCKAAYDWSNNTVLDLLMAGYLLRPACACKGRARSSDEDVPTLLKEFRHLCHYLGSEEKLRRHGSFHEIVRLEVGSVMVARAMLDFSSERISIFIDREALKTATGKTAASLTWPRLKAEALERQADLYEDQTGGDRLKLQFRWSEYHRNWSAHANVEGATVTYVIHRNHESGMSEGWWYVRLANPNPRPGEVRRVVGVIPMAMVPPRYIPAQPAPRPPPPPSTPARTPFNTPHFGPRRR